MLKKQGFVWLTVSVCCWLHCLGPEVRQNITAWDHGRGTCQHVEGGRVSSPWWATLLQLLIHMSVSGLQKHIYVPPEARFTRLSRVSQSR